MKFADTITADRIKTALEITALIRTSENVFTSTVLIKFLIYLITNLECCRNTKHSSAFYVTLHPRGVPWSLKPTYLAEVASH